MGKGFNGVLLRALGAKEHAATVTGKEHRAEHFVRIRMHSETVLRSEGEAPANWVRAWFPDPEGGSTLFQRGYTLLEAQAETGDFCMDFVLHEPAGPASAWARDCEIGDQIAVMRYGEKPFEQLDPPPRGYLLLGDLAAHPAISSIAATIPPEHQVVVYLERHSPADEQIPLPEGPNITAAWVDELPDGQALVQAIACHDWTDWYAWVTGETVSTRHAKTLLQREHDLNRATLHSQAYWIRGRAMGKHEEIQPPQTRTQTEKQTQTERETETLTPTRAGEKQTPALPGPIVGTDSGRDPAAISVGRPNAVGTGRTADGAHDVHVGPTGVPMGSGTAGTEPVTEGASGQERVKSAASHAARRAPTEGVLAPARRALWAGGIVAGLLAILRLVPYMLFAEMARLFLAGAESSHFLTTGLWAVAVLGVTTLGTSALMLGLHLYDARFSAALRRRLMDKMTTLPLGWFFSRGSGEVKKLVSDDVSALHHVVVHAMVDAVRSVVMPLTVLVYLFTVQWRLGLVLLIPLIVYIVVMVSIARGDAGKAATVQRQISRSASQMQTFLATHEVSRIFGRRAVVDLEATLGEQGDFVAEWQRETGPRKIMAVMINRPTTVLGVLVLGGFAMLSAGWIPAADLIPFLILGTSFSGQLMAVSMSVYALYSALESRDGLALLLGTPSLPPPEGRIAPPGHVRFDNVRFGYGPDRVVLPDLSLSLERGAVTALVGPSGAGKSTVASLAGPVVGSAGRVREHRGTGPARAQRRGAVRAGDDPAAGRPAAPHHDPREHRPHPAGGHPGTDPRRGASRSHPRAHHGPAPGVRHRRGRRQALRWRTTAHRHRSGTSGRYPDRGARRGHSRGRPRFRMGHPAGPGPAPGGPDRADDRPPPAHRHHCRPDHGDGQGLDPGIRHP